MNLYAGLPLGVQALFWIALAGTIWMFATVIVLAILAARGRRTGTVMQPHADDDDLLWVFVVPALNEAVTIADSVDRLIATHANNAVILVVDDASTDDTANILDGITDRRLEVLHRTAPDARLGKADALNAAFRHLISEVLPRPAFRRWSAARVIVGVVDADGRLDPDAPAAIAPYFADPEVGGVQSLVRIYNRRGWLTWAQDVEFRSFGFLFQAGRSRWGSANMGGNGQFTRLSALVQIADADGPWRHRLTEDQDLGVRLLQAGWRSHQENSVTVQQQGLNSLRRLYRQRARWAQGAWQALSLLPGSGGLRALPVAARADAIGYLLTPILQLIIGISIVLSAVMSTTGSSYEPVQWWLGLVFVTIGFGPGIVTLANRAPTLWAALTAIPLAIPYALYAWVLLPTNAIGLLRHVLGRHTWSKTPREPIRSSPIEVPDRITP